MNFEVAIPSYNRSRKLRDQTLKMLQTEGFDANKITIFVSSAEERQEYLSILTPGTYGQILIGRLGLKEQREVIESYFPLNTNILQMDDDIKRIKMLNPKPLIEVCNEMFRVSRLLGANLWGIYPVNNLFFCKERVIYGKIFCVGCFFGLINQQDQVYPNSLGEDKWRTLYRYKKDGGCLRYDGICPDTTYNARGGLYEYRLLHRDQEIREICKIYPEDCYFKRRKNGVAEVVWTPKIERVLSYTTADESEQVQQGEVGIRPETPDSTTALS